MREPVPPLSEVARRRCVQRFKALGTLAAVSRELKYPIWQVRQAVVETLGEQAVPSARRRDPPMPLKDLRTEYEAGASLRKLAEKYGEHYTMIRSWLLRAGTTLRPPSTR